jgi:hypothetical protein
MTMPAPLDQTAEERALAQRLARLGPNGEPSPQLDARVLAAARAALDAPPVSAHRSRRWPVALGVAASLVLAVGVAWRLRPLPPGSTADLAPPTHTASQSNPAPVAAEPATAVPAAQATPEAAGDAGIAVASPPPPEVAPRRAAKTVAAPAAAPDVQVDVDVPAPITPEAAAPTAPQSLQKSKAVQQAAGAATDANEADELNRATTSEAQTEAGDEPLDAMPPATADAPGVRDAWLSRIRALIDSGDVSGGRRSLRAFVERYPDYPLLEDLRALQQ